MHEALEHHEHAEHAAHEGSKRAALLVAVLAALLAICEEGAKNSEIRVQENSIAAADAWSQYQAKSVRATISRDLAELLATLDPPQSAEAASKRAEVIKQLRADEAHYEHAPGDSKDVISVRAHSFEAARDYALEQTHTFDKGTAAFELGIVLATASAITVSGPLFIGAVGVGVAGAVLGLLGLLAPGLAAF